MSRESGQRTTECITAEFLKVCPRGQFTRPFDSWFSKFIYLFKQTDFNGTETDKAVNAQPGNRNLSLSQITPCGRPTHVAHVEE